MVAPPLRTESERLWGFRKSNAGLGHLRENKSSRLRLSNSKDPSPPTPLPGGERGGRERYDFFSALAAPAGGGARLPVTTTPTAGTLAAGPPAAASAMI